MNTRSIIPAIVCVATFSLAASRRQRTRQSTTPYSGGTLRHSKPSVYRGLPFRPSQVHVRRLGRVRPCGRGSALRCQGTAHIQGKAIIGLDRVAADRLFAYQWPGNLRELSKVVHAAVALTTGSVTCSSSL